MKTILLILFLLLISAGITWLVCKALKVISMAKRFQDYNEDMKFLEGCIQNWIVNKRNCCLIDDMFDQIAHNNQNPERTMIAWYTYKEKYKVFYPEYMEEIKEVINQN